MDFKEKKLYRSRNNRLISGVCGGLGEYFEVNSNIIRFIFLISNFFLSGISTLAYFILSGVIPEENKILKEGDKILSNESSGFLGLINLFNKINRQVSIKDQDESVKDIFSQEVKDMYSQSSRVELDGYKTESGISFDWRAKLMIILFFMALGYFLWKLGLLRFLNF